MTHPLCEETKWSLAPIQIKVLFQRTVLNLNACLTKRKRRLSPLYFPETDEGLFSSSNGYIVVWNRFFINIFNIFQWWIEVTLAVGRCVRY